MHGSVTVFNPGGNTEQQIRKCHWGATFQALSEFLNGSMEVVVLSTRIEDDRSVSSSIEC